jgi:hypothetical protein
MSTRLHMSVCISYSLPNSRLAQKNTVETLPIFGQVWSNCYHPEFLSSETSGNVWSHGFGLPLWHSKDDKTHGTDAVSSSAASRIRVRAEPR